MDIKTEVLENLENLENLSPEQKEKVAEEVSTQFKQLQSSTSKGVQHLNEAIKFYKESANDPQKLLELQGSNPEVAKIVLDKFFDGQTIEDLLPQNPEIEPSELDTKVKEAVQSQKVDDLVSSAVAQLPEEMQSKFKDEFTELTEGKKLTSETVGKYISLTIKSISPDVNLNVEQQARLASIGTV
jgi:hypothetical protein